MTKWWYVTPLPIFGAAGPAAAFQVVTRETLVRDHMQVCRATMHDDPAILGRYWVAATASYKTETETWNIVGGWDRYIVCVTNVCMSTNQMLGVSSYPSRTHGWLKYKGYDTVSDGLSASYHLSKDSSLLSISSQTSLHSLHVPLQ